ncbi:MAG: CdaR family protein [Andreesenia angusta]|nr:CdaR family protein [Andreesenia angusta]
MKNKKLFFKFLSLIIAILLWFLAMGDINPTRTKEFLNIPVQYTGLKDGLIITKEGRKNIDIEVIGRRNEIADIHRSNFDIKVDLEDIGPGEHRIRLYDEDEFRFNNYQIVYNPEYIDLKIEKLIDKKFDIQVEINGNIKDGFDTDKISLSNKTCTVKGPESVINSISKVVAVLEGRSISSNKPIEKELIAVDKNGKIVKGIEMSVKSVSINIPFGDNNIAGIEPNIVGELAEGYKIESIEINPKNINLIKESSDIDDINTVYTENIDISGNTESFEKKVALLIPEGFKYSKDNTVNIKVNIKKTEEENRDDKIEEKLINMNISGSNFVNKADDIEIVNIDSINTNIDILVEGDKSKLETLDSSKLNLKLDLSSALESGEYTIPIIANIEDDSLKIKSIKPDSILVKIKREEMVEDRTN